MCLKCSKRKVREKGAEPPPYQSEKCAVKRSSDTPSAILNFTNAEVLFAVFYNRNIN